MRQQLGVGVMIKMLRGTLTNVDLNVEFTGQKVTALVLDNETQLRITFESGRTVTIWDDGQSCCEHRYMSTDDDLSQFVGAAFLGHEVRAAPDQEDEYGEVSECQFLVILTDRGNIVFANHNEHNGYYGGFVLTATVDTPEIVVQHGTGTAAALNMLGAADEQ